MIISKHNDYVKYEFLMTIREEEKRGSGEQK